jgi:hypothetical protein
MFIIIKWSASFVINHLAAPIHSKHIKRKRKNVLPSKKMYNQLYSNLSVCIVRKYFQPNVEWTIM